MDWDCPKCEHANESPFPFGDNVICCNCQTEYETEAEYGWDSMCAWVTNETIKK